MTEQDLREGYEFLDVDNDGHIEIEDLEQLEGEYLDKDEQEFIKTHGEYLFDLADQTDD